MEHVGMDLGKKESQSAIITEAGELVEKRLRTKRERLMRYFKDRPPARILMEASTISEWVARLLDELGHEVVVADPNFAPMYAQRSRRVKTDKRDALALFSQDTRCSRLWMHHWRKSASMRNRMNCRAKGHSSTGEPSSRMPTD